MSPDNHHDCADSTFTPPRPIHWPHAPIHKLAESGTYFVTCGTYLKSHHFQGSNRLEVLHRGLLSVAAEFRWRLEAWVVFSNHYHFVAHSPGEDDNAESLSKMLSKLHSRTAAWANKLDQTPGRQVWHNFRETKLTNPGSYLARLNYVHHNAVKHGLVGSAAAYPWCSARWFERTAAPAQVKLVYGIQIDRVRVYDDFSPAEDW